MTHSKISRSTLTMLTVYAKTAKLPSLKVAARELLAQYQERHKGLTRYEVKP